MFHLLAKKKRLSLEVDIDDAVPGHIFTDQGKLRQILTNLLSNALKFTYEGGVLLNVTAPAPQDESIKLIFEVTDTGAGIAVEDVDKVFEPFAQTASGVAIQTGTGLGMTISREYACAMGGDLSVTSQLGQGSTFRLEIQAEGGVPSTVAFEVPRRRVSRLAPGQPTYKVLIVDDMETNRDFLMQLLIPLGFSARDATNGVEAIEAFEDWSPDVILMDVRMPVMDGFTAIERIKSLPGGTEALVIAVTAHAFEEERLEILRRGADGFLRKPLKAQILLDSLQRHLGLDYVYEDVQEIAKLPEPGGAGIEISRQALRSLPEVVIDHMRKAVEILDAKGMEAIIENISVEDEGLAEGLRHLVDDFEWDTLSDLLGQENQ